MNTAMFIFVPRSIRRVFAICFLVTAGPALAEEELSEHWMDERQLEMTRDLSAKIEDDASTFMARYIEGRLAHFDSHRDRIAAASPAAPAATVSAAGKAAAGAKRSRTTCQTSPDHGFTCTVRPAR